MLYALCVCFGDVSSQITTYLLQFYSMCAHWQTNRSQLNNSPFKQLYSFPKSDRFTVNHHLTKAPYYDNKVSAFGNRTCTFGFGNKITMQSKQNVPPPGKYQRDGVFDYSIKKKKGYSFSHDSKKGLINESQIKFIPGPGKYNYTTDKFDYKRVSFSFRGKYEDPLSRHQNPLGPGQYTTIGDINTQGKYPLTNFHNSGCSKIGKSNRFPNYETISPGPGKYEDGKVTGFNQSGVYFNSTYRTSQTRRFGKQQKRHFADPSTTPGPGSYRRFSDFPQQK